MKDNLVKSVGRISTAVLLFVVGGAVSSDAQQGRLGQGVQSVEHNRVGNSGIGLIPNSHYRAHFGPEHKFHLGREAYGQDRRFAYGGYSFGFVDEWPTNWLPQDDVFVTQIDGQYYLGNHWFPGVNIPLNVGANRDASIRQARTRPPKATRAKSRTVGTSRAG